MAAEWVWYACDFPTGQLLTRLPLSTTAVSAGLNMIGSAQFTLPLRDPMTPTEWEQATQPRRTVIVGEVNGRVVWSGIIWQRTRSQEDTIELQCATIESFYARRYVDVKHGPYLNVDQAQIGLNLLHHAQSVKGYGSDTFGPVYQVFLTGVKRDRTEYDRFADQKIYDMVQNLAQLEDGFEWYVDANWAAGITPKRLSYFVHLATTQGNITTAPEWVFEYPGNIVSWGMDEDFTDEAYANAVVAGGEGEEEARIMSTSGIAQDSVDIFDHGNPMVEYRLQTQLTTQENVNAAARGALARIKRGSTALSLVATDEVFQQVGRFSLGDTCKVRITGGGFPNGYKQLHRVVAWTMDPSNGTITPQLNPYGD